MSVILHAFGQQQINFKRLIRLKLIELLTFFFRYSDTEKEVKQLKLEIKSKGEEIQLLQKQMSQNEANNEKVKERLSNMAQEKQQLLERYSLGFVH